MFRLPIILTALLFVAAPAAAIAGERDVLAIISHTVKDYAVWRAVYDDFGDEQAAGGVTDEAVFQDPQDPNRVVVLHYFASLDDAKAFLALPELASAMAGAGVAGPPDITIVASSD